MSTSTKRALLLGAIFTSILCAGVLIALALSGGSAGGTLASGRSIMTYSDGLTLKSNFSADTAIIRTAGYTIVVGPTDLTVDGRTLAQIEESVADVKVHVQNGAIEFVADGSTIPYGDQ